MKIIKINKKLNKYFIGMYIDNEVAGVTQSTEKPRIEFVKNKISNGFIEVNNVILYFDKLELK